MARWQREAHHHSCRSASRRCARRRGKQDKRAFGYTVVGYVLAIAGTVVSTPELRKTVFRLITGGLGPLLGGLPSLPTPSPS